MRYDFLCLLAVVAVLFAGAAGSFADKLIMKDGTTIEGKIINKNAQLITIEVMEKDKKREMIVISNRVARIEEAAVEPMPAAEELGEDVKTGPTYAVVSIQKVFGIETQAAVVRKMLEACAVAKPDFIIIDIDSPGGMVDEMLQVMDVLSHWQQTQTIPLVAYVRKEALSAAALTAMSVKEIYMSPTSTMGAAMIISVDAAGGVKALDSTREGEKFSSAIRAKARSHAELAGHSPEIVDAMIDPDVGLSMGETKAGKKVVLRGTPAMHKAADYKAAPTLVLEPGKLLTMTPTEATKLGVIKGVAKDIDELGTKLGKTGWRQTATAATKIHDEHLKAIETANSDYDKSIKRIKDAETMIVRADGRNLSVYEDSALVARASVVKIEKLAKEHPFIGHRVALDFPEGTYKLRLVLDEFIGRINAAKRARVR